MGKPQGPPAKAIVAGRRPYWTAEEDAQLVRLVKKYGTKNWGIIAKELHSPIPRKGKSCRSVLRPYAATCLAARTHIDCRSRWMHQLNPCIKHEPFSVEEERILIAKQREFGNKWSKIAAFLPGRTDNAIKNHWHGHVKRRLSARGFSSDEEDILMEMKSEEPWNDVVELFPVPLLRSRLNSSAASHAAQRDMECARILLELSRTNIPHPPLLSSYVGTRSAADVFVKKEPLSEEEGSETSKEPNNGYAAVTAATASVAGTRGPKDEENNCHVIASSKQIQPDPQKILTETLESAGLAHYAVLPLCPIKEEDINSEQHVVIVLPSSDDVPLHDSCSEGASVCVLPEERVSGIRDLAQTSACAFLESRHHRPVPSAYAALCDPSSSETRETVVVNENLSALFPAIARQDGTKPVRLFNNSPEFDSSISPQHLHHHHRHHHPMH